MPTIEDIAARTLKAGKHAGIFVMDAAYTGRFEKMGYTFHGARQRTEIRLDGRLGANRRGARRPDLNLRPT